MDANFNKSQILLITKINAPIEIVFDLARSIDLHTLSLAKSREKAVAGVTSGLIELNETVTWKAKHFGIRFLLTSKITEFCKNEYFVDEMTKGPFKSLYHKHSFNFKDDCTEMKDEFNFVSPMGVLGRLANTLFLKNYLKNLLEHRNQTIKKMAETGVWKNMVLINTA